MKKVVLASLLACAAIASGLPSAYAQQPVALGTGAQAANQPVQLSAEEAAAYNNANSQAAPQAKATALEAYLTAYPQSQIKLNVLETLMVIYGQQLNDVPKALDTADRVLQVAPNTVQALLFEALLRKPPATVTDPAAMQAAWDTAAGYAQKGLAATKPADMTDDAFKTLMTQVTPSFYSVIGNAALNKNDNAAAIDNFKKELGSVPVDQTTVPGPILQDTYGLAAAYYQSKPPDLLNCAFYASRVVDYAPDNMKANFSQLAKFCYKKYHGKDDGYDAVAAIAKTNLNPPADFAAGITPAPTPAEQIHTIITTTTDLATLAIADKEMVFQYGSPEDAAKVWDTIKGKSVQIPDALVIESSATVIKVAVDPGNIQSKIADFTFNMTPPEELTEPKATATPAVKAAYKAAKAKADAVTEATAVGKTVTLTGTYDSFTPNPVMITMKDGDVVLPKAAAKPAAKPAAHPAAGAHKAPAHH